MTATAEKKKMGGSDHVVERITHLSRNHSIVIEEVSCLEPKLKIGQIPGIDCQGKVRADNPTLHKFLIIQQNKVIGGLEPGEIRKFTEWGLEGTSIDKTNGRRVALVVKVGEIIVKGLKKSIGYASFPI